MADELRRRHGRPSAGSFAVARRSSALGRAVRRCSTSPAWSPTSSSPIRRTTFRRVVGVRAAVLLDGAPVALAVVLPLRRPAAGGLARRRASGRLAGGRRRPGRRGPASRQPLLLRADDSQPDLRGAVRRAARVHRPRSAADRQPDGRRRAREWAQWMLLLALGGFVGNFVFSLTDHAQNGFFNPRRVDAGRQQRIRDRLSARAVCWSTWRRRTCGCAAWCSPGRPSSASLALRFHVSADFAAGADAVRAGPDGAPPMAPLLFLNLSLLAGIALAAWFDAPEPQR